MEPSNRAWVSASASKPPLSTRITSSAVDANSRQGDTRRAAANDAHVGVQDGPRLELASVDQHSLGGIGGGIVPAAAPRVGRVKNVGPCQTPAVFLPNL